MAVQIFPESRQGHGAFNGGEIVENKPIGFPQDGSELRPYSNLFYWAHARAVTDSTIGLHPHQGFEICSFVLKGPIRHYDTKLKDWKPLQTGDVQIIRSGSGISHSEWMGEGAEIFQIWFDPDLAKTLAHPASYDDYRAADFPTLEPAEGVRRTIIAGEGSPFQMESQGIGVERWHLEQANFEFPLPAGFLMSAYLLEGEAFVNGEKMVKRDFALVRDAATVRFETEGRADIFAIFSPVQPGYRTYAQIRRIQSN